MSDTRQAFAFETMTQAIRKTVPEPLAPIPFHIPKPISSTLDNGLRVVIFPDGRLPLVSYRLAFLSGDANDPVGKTGLTSAFAAMLSEGTENYSSRELAEKVERLGASVSAHSSEDFTVVAASSLSIYASEILSIVAEVLTRPSFPEAELDLYKRNTIENLKFQRSQPSFLANEQVARILYGEHPYATVAPSPEEVERLTRESLFEFHRDFLAPGNAVLIAVGDVDEKQFLSEVNEHFGAWEKAEVSTGTFPDPPSRSSRTVKIVDRPGSAQANIVLANLAFERSSTDFFAATVMNQILGAGASSRVFMNLREEKGYTYGAYTRFDPKRLQGDFEATAEVRTAVTGDSLREFFYELERIRSERVSEAELADAKNFLTGVFPIRAETQEGLTNLLLNQQLYQLPDDYLQTYRDNIEAIKADDVQRVAEKYVHPDSLAMVIVGDAAEVLPQISGYADDIHIVDTDGNKVDRSKYENVAEAEPAEVSGTWELALDFQGQQVPVTLKLVQQDGQVSGSIETILGSGRIESGTVDGGRLSATAVTEIQGESVEFSITGSVDSDSMRGTLSSAIIPDALPFEGKRVS